MFRTRLFVVTFLMLFMFFLPGCHILDKLRSSSVSPVKKEEKVSAKTVTPKVIDEHKEEPPGTPPQSDVPPTEQETEGFFKTQGEESPDNMDNLAIIVSYFRFLNSLPEKAIAQEHRRTEKEFKQNNNPVNRLRLAMLLGLSKSRHRDTDQSLSLLAAFLDKPDQDPLLKDFSFLLYTLIQERQSEAKHHSDLSIKLKKEAGENKKLKKMIEELKTIEENIMKRDEAS